MSINHQPIYGYHCRARISSRAGAAESATICQCDVTSYSVGTNHRRASFSTYRFHYDVLLHCKAHGKIQIIFYLHVRMQSFYLGKRKKKATRRRENELLRSLHVSSTPRLYPSSADVAPQELPFLLR